MVDVTATNTSVLVNPGDGGSKIRIRRRPRRAEDESVERRSEEKWATRERMT
jgi:hypothetical protein